MYGQFPYSYYGANPMNALGNTSSLLNLTKRFNWDGFLNNAQRTLNVINQAMPIYNQVKPMFKNMGTIFRVIGELNSAPAASTVASAAPSSTPQFFS